MSILNLNPVFFLLLAISGNFVAETLGCKTQKLLTQNMFAKQIVVLALLFFTMTLTTEKNVAPHDNFKSAVIYFALFLMATKTTPFFTSLLFCIMVTMFIINSYIEYYKEQNVPTKDLEKAQKGLKIAFFVVLVLGFGLYARKQVKAQKNFSPVKFLFGTNSCANN